MKKRLEEKLASTAVGNRLLSDQLFRSALIACGNMGWNLLYGIFNGVLGVLYRSAWFITMGVYHLTLGLMRLSVVTLRTDKNNRRTEISVMRHNGIAMVFLAVVISASVALSFLYSVARTYHVPVMIAIATYTFFITALAIRNVILAHKERSLFMISLRNISLAGATASMLTLQRSMTATFGAGEAAASFANTMNGATGMGAFLIVLSLGIMMIVQGKRSRQNSDSI